jgi:H(+)-transporting ATP synthase subunit D
MNRPERLAVTRQNLLRAKRRLERVGKGAQLLRKRREALAHELLRLARPAVDARTLLVRQSREAYGALAHALAEHGESGLHALAWPSHSVPVDIRFVRVWGVPVAEIIRPDRIRRSIDARGHAPAGTGPAVTDAADRFEVLVDLLLDAAPREMVLRRLGHALARTSRQVHALEKNVAPALASQIASVRGSLEEREREEHHRLKHFLRVRAARAAGR